MKLSIIKYLVILAASIFAFTGCSEDSDSEPTTTQLPGNYVITKATVAETFTLSLTGGSFQVPVGFPITEGIQAALLGAVECSSPDKTYIELRTDNSLYLSCEGENALNAGTWQEVSATELILNMNSAAIPSSPTGFSLTVTDIATTTTGIKGTTSVPLPKEIIAALLPENVELAETPAIYIVSFTLELTKK